MTWLKQAMFSWSITKPRPYFLCQWIELIVFNLCLDKTLTLFWCYSWLELDHLLVSVTWLSELVLTTTLHSASKCWCLLFAIFLMQPCRMSKIRRKVTVENSKTISDSSSSTTTPSRRPSVFERLGPSTASNAAEVGILVTHYWAMETWWAAYLESISGV